MNQDLLKRLPLRLEQGEYQQLREQVLRRDGWRCQFCGSMSNLEVHHQQFRSHSGPDEENNLITLCSGCHWGEHNIGMAGRSTHRRYRNQ
jgi:5-methylcytosine-specific restriction endonuclease McrA